MGAAVLVGALTAKPAHAATFQPDGSLVLERDAVVQLAFDDLSKLTGVTAGAGQPLEGKGFAVLGSEARGAQFETELNLPSNGRYALRGFIRKNRTRGTVVVGKENDPYSQTEAILFPTGRVTSDGWYEVATSPFRVPAGTTATLSLLASGADLDGFEVVRDGTFAPLASCELSGDARCGVGEYCAARSCHDGTIEVPQYPKSAADRKELADYIKSRLQMFGGGRFSRRENMPKVFAILDTLSATTNNWDFWNGFATAIHALGDWHTKTSGAGQVAGRGAFPICFVEGEADLSHPVAPKHPSYPDVLVSHVGPMQNSGLKPGDRLVAVNGQHPIAFAESLGNIDWDFWRANDPSVHAEAVERMRFLIRRWAKEITIVRCDAAAGVCGGLEVIPVTSLPDQEPALYPECDHRPTYPIAGPDARTHAVNGVLAGQVIGEDTRTWGMVWNSTLLDGGNNPYKAPIDQLVANADRVILDHRTGNGGTEFGAEFLTQAFRAPASPGASSPRTTTLGEFDEPFTTETGLSLLNIYRNNGSNYRVGSSAARPDLRTALLLARDGSGSDWFPMGMKDAGNNVRIFGRRTAGAFSSFYQFDYYGGLRFQFAAGDFLRNDGTTHLGEGVAPDEEVLPKQSDLIVGRDTVVQRALAWLKQP
jgi:Peptidase family S41